MTPPVGPARLSRWLRALLPGAIGAEVCDLLDEQHARLRTTRGVCVAWLWYASHFALPGTWILRRALIEQRPHAASSLVLKGTLLMEFRYALRALRRSPALSLSIVLTLALGIGTAATMLGIVDRLFIRHVALMRDPDTVHRVYTARTTSRGARVTQHSMNYGQYEDLRQMTASFTQTAVFSEQRLPVGANGVVRERAVLAVSASYFDFFAATPVRGRFFAPDEDRPPVAAPVAILSHDFWTREFGGADVIGRSIRIGELPMTIVGVAPAAFTGIEDAYPAAIFVPVAALAAIQESSDPTFFGYYRFGWANVLVRRAPGVSVEQASADLHQARQRSWQKERETIPGDSIDIAQPSAFAGPVRRAAGPTALPETRLALWIAGLAITVLLVSCANVAHLLSTRALARHRELKIRVAIGAGTWRVMSPLIAESLLLAGAGATLGVLLVHWGGAALFDLLKPHPLAVPIDTLVDLRAIIATAALGAGVGMLTSLAPVWIATRGSSGLRGRAETPSRRATWLRNGLVIFQGACSAALLIGSALFVRSVWALDAVPRGFDYENVLVISPSVRSSMLEQMPPPILRQSIEEGTVAFVPEHASSWATAAPLWRTFHQPLFVEGIESTAAAGQISLYPVDADYFSVVSTGLLRGRGITRADAAGAPPVVVVSDSMAQAFWPGREPIGQCIRVAERDAPCRTVVGVVQNTLQSSGYEQQDLPRLQLYAPLAQLPTADVGFLLLKTDGAPAALADQLRTALDRRMPAGAYVRVEPLADRLSVIQRPWRLGAVLFTGGGLLALIVAVVGLFGAISHGVAQRSRELAIRAALGAAPHALHRRVIGEGTLLAAAAVVCGSGIALAAGSRLEPLLFRQSITDPLVHGAVAAVFLAVALAATLPAAQRAAAADPIRALRAE